MCLRVERAGLLSMESLVLRTGALLLREEAPPTFPQSTTTHHGPAIAAGVSHPALYHSCGLLLARAKYQQQQHSPVSQHASRAAAVFRPRPRKADDPQSTQATPGADSDRRVSGKALPPPRKPFPPHPKIRALRAHQWVVVVLLPANRHRVCVIFTSPPLLPSCRRSRRR